MLKYLQRVLVNERSSCKLLAVIPAAIGAELEELAINLSRNIDPIETPHLFLDMKNAGVQRQRLVSSLSRA
jgi:hypothetical protein